MVNVFLSRKQVFEARAHLEAMGNLIEAIGEATPEKRKELWSQYFENRSQVEKILPAPPS